MMRHYIYKLKFLTPVRFGLCNAGADLAQGRASCPADTLFSALGQEWMAVYGRQGFEEFIEAAQNNRILISDMFPWSGTELYLPKPALPPLFRTAAVQEESTDRKALKKLAYILVSRFQDYLDFLRNGGEPDRLLEPAELAVDDLLYRASIAREEDTRPYPVAVSRFREDSGLYFILKTTEEWREKFDRVVASLGLTGIGGKRSSGLGRFEPAEESFETGLYDSDCILEDMLNENGDVFMSLAVLAPAREDLDIVKQEKSFYTLSKRTGFVASPDYAGTYLKKKPVVMFNAGSCFPEKIAGRILDVAERGGHPVYRYGKGMYVGVKVWS